MLRHRTFNFLLVKGISFKCKMTNINTNIRNASTMLTTNTSVAINLSLKKFALNTSDNYSDSHNGPNYSYNSTEGGIIYDRFSYQLDRKNKVAIDCRCINSKCKAN